MTPQQIDSMKLALEALKNNKPTHRYCEDIWYSCPKHEDGCADEREGDECNCGADEINAEFDKAITALEEALAEHAMREVQRLGQEIEQEPVVYQCPRCATSMQVDLTAKAALAQPEQEPVAKVIDWGVEGPRLQGFTNDWPVVGTLLYTAPPQRTWVGLTDAEKLHIEIMGGKSDVMLAEMVEAKLKEKNA